MIKYFVFCDKQTSRLNIRNFVSVSDETLALARAEEVVANVQAGTKTPDQGPTNDIAKPNLNTTVRTFYELVKNSTDPSIQTIQIESERVLTKEELQDAINTFSKEVTATIDLKNLAETLKPRGVDTPKVE